MTNTACEPEHLPYPCSNLLLNTHSKKNITDGATQEKRKLAIPKAADAGNVTCGKTVICSYAVQIYKQNKMFKLQQETSTECNFRHTHASCFSNTIFMQCNCTIDDLINIFTHQKQDGE
jgi:hypothetical protein